MYPLLSSTFLVGLSILVWPSSSTVEYFASLDSTSATKEDGKAPFVHLTLWSHRQVMERRMLAVSNESLVAAELHQGLGTHYVDLWVGSPVPQLQTVIVDTGSDLTAFPCGGGYPYCDSADTTKNCGEEHHLNDPYMPSQSYSFREAFCGDCRLGNCDEETARCNMEARYREGSGWTAVESVDVVRVSDQTGPSFDLRFGCQNQLTGLFQTQLADGILGMGPGEDNNIHKRNSKKAKPFWKQRFEQLGSSSSLMHPKFSLCLRRGGGGTMTLGGATCAHNSMLFAATSPRRSQKSAFYTVVVEAVHLVLDQNNQNNQNNTIRKNMLRVKVPTPALNRQPTVVDSGTTYTYFTQSLRRPFHDLWKEMTGFDFPSSKLGWKGKETDLATTFPTVVLQLRGSDHIPGPGHVRSDQTNTSHHNVLHDNDETPAQARSRSRDVMVKISPEDYMEYHSQTDSYHSGLFFDEEGGSVLGANTLVGHDVLFDLEEPRKTGWAESGCDCLEESQLG